MNPKSIIHYDEFNVEISECGIEIGLKNKHIKMTSNLKDVTCISCLSQLIIFNQIQITNLNDLIAILDNQITIAHNNRKERLVK